MRCPMSDSESTAPASNSGDGTPPEQYRVLARKYRPSTFSELIGQEAMVRVLTNAVSSGRLAHAFMMTGVRGVGKTTTARIIARGLNCIGPEGDPDFGPTVEPCGVCEHCIAIAEDRHVDVLEMDAASRTGVDDIRELIEGVRYRPTSARYKVYIIDEVHMLSKNAFNALLKTLEEPPEHVKFIFATTEIRKVPVTVLSRCQRFDLRRVEVEELATHFAGIAEKEGANISSNALTLVARAADGSVRDGLSLLDQAISHTEREISEDDIREMLGLADRGQSFDVFEAVLKGDAAGALEVFARQYHAGADPAQVIEDLLEVTHWITRIKISPTAADDVTVPEIERTRGRQMAEGLGMAAISRAWQMLLKGLSEVRVAPSAVQAAEMVLIRLAHAANLPSPEEALKSLSAATEGNAAGGSVTSGGGSSGGGASAGGPGEGVRAVSGGQSISAHGSGGGASRAALSIVESDPDMEARDMQTAPEPVVQPEAPASSGAVFTDLIALAARAGERREMTLQAFLMNNVRIVHFEPGRIELNGGEHADGAMIQRLRAFLHEETDIKWVVSVSAEPGDATLSEQSAAIDSQRLDEAREAPLVKSALEIFPGAQVKSVEEHALVHDDGLEAPLDDGQSAEDDI